MSDTKDMKNVQLKVTFSQASTRANLTSKENIATSFGKLAKWYTDLSPLAWSGKWEDLTGTIPIANKTTWGLVYSGSTVKDISGYEPCPIVDGVPYYKKAGVELYGCKIDRNDSNPETRVTYMYDNAGWAPARMYFSSDETSNRFSYGNNWGKAFFVRHNYPVMCKFDGTEDYKLDPNDHSKKLDGTASDVSNFDYAGNAMSCFDCHIWIKHWGDADYEYYAVSNVQIDPDFKDYPYIRPDGSHADKIYYPMYKGMVFDDRLRSISGGYPQNKTTATAELTYATANGPNWIIGDWAHREWLNVLLLLLGRNDNSQAVYGNGCTTGGVDNASIHYGFVRNGSLDQKGRFYGYSEANSTTNAVKVFFIENWWGCRWDRCLGLWNDKGDIKVSWKPPYSTVDSSGCISTGITAPATGWQKETETSNEYGRIPYSTGGSSTTYTCDYFWSNNAQNNLALVGGGANGGTYCGCWYVALDTTPSNSRWNLGASPYLIQPS